MILLAACIASIWPHPDIPMLRSGLRPAIHPPLYPLCSAVLNRFSQVNFTARIWICPFCYQRNHLGEKGRIRFPAGRPNYSVGEWRFCPLPRVAVAVAFLPWILKESRRNIWGR